MGPDTWPSLRDTIDGHDVRGTLFDIPPNCHAGQLLRLKEFKLEVAMPYVYNRFIESWGMFSDHDHVPLYFEKHIYA